MTNHELIRKALPGNGSRINIVQEGEWATVAHVRVEIEDVGINNDLVPTLIAAELRHMAERIDAEYHYQMGRRRSDPAEKQESAAVE